jgi:DNA-directed RNA polymerase subunit RPC12/RpoP
MSKKLTLDLKCLRCGHEWLRRSLTKEPKACPGCNSPYWNKPRKGEA